MQLPVFRFRRVDLYVSTCFDPRWPSVGPHEGREAWLMAAGWKPAALFCDVLEIEPTAEEAAFAPLLATGMIERHDHILAACVASIFPYQLRLTIYVPTGHTALAACIRRLHLPADHRPDIGHVSEFDLGRALGYGDADVRAFVLRSGCFA